MFLAWGLNDELRCSGDVCIEAHYGLKPDIAPCLKSATTGLMQRSKNHLPNDCLVPKLSRRLGISDQTFGWIWVPRRNPSEHQTDVVAAICLDC